MRTELEIAQAKDILERAKERASVNGSPKSDVLMLRMSIDLLKWALGEPSQFGPQLDVTRKHIMSGMN